MTTSIPFNEILKGFNRDSGQELFSYGNEITTEILRIIEKLNPSRFSGDDKDAILKIVDEFCTPELYLKRYTIMVSSIERRTFSYGIKVELPENIIGLNKAICESYARNNTKRIKSKIENELNCLVESFLSQDKKPKNKVSEVVECLELKPNFFGLGININAILTKLRLRKKT